MKMISNLTLRDNTHRTTPMRHPCDYSRLDLCQHSGSNDLKIPFSWNVPIRHVLQGRHVSGRLKSRFRNRKTFVNANYLLSKQDLTATIR
ncbi:hypothetical protein N7463_008107 [Penicillium fimorum]|uniref:Uncharacterized protein n=1 Tax=Penicillium fimorum TaxID=1882269 RepID=A0A9W9XRZ2_9EURO|nr:hypothetical protein N7463_008107 [Penicillium fimorum]